MKKLIFILISLSLLLTACGKESPPEPASFDITGTWEYTMTTEGSEDIYDSGTITFTGNPDTGEYIELNFYEIEYTGTYLVTKISVILAGDTEIQGSFTNENHMIGAWGDDDTNGRWEATRITE
ncbi:MAG: hypothetical protein HN392_08830 [Anaerolineae bacterium]|nr:hypothetical protein [Anaerolineae bacterium]MBT7074412.1 hypothetical protein [Anaerolineae bacterium]MBT7782762.1 hypothetical protein [Anaerolineae bacterium]